MNISLKTKLGILLPMGVLLVMATIILSTFWVNSRQKGYGQLINLSGRQRMLSQKMSKEILGILREKEGRSSGVNYRESLATSRELFDKTLNALMNGGETVGSDGKPVILPVPSNPDIVTILKEGSELWQEFNKNIDLLLSGEISLDSDEFRKALVFIEANNTNLLKSMNDVTGIYEKEAERKVYLLKVVQVWAFIITLIIVTLGFWLVNRIIIKPLGHMADHLNSVATGNLVAEIKVKSSDEIGKMAATVNGMTANLRGMVKDIIDTSSKVASASAQISSATDELAAGSEIQKISMDKTSSTIDEMSVSIGETAANTSKLSITAEEASSSTIEISASIDEVAKISEELSYTVEEVSSSISEMAASVKEIAGHAAHLSSYTADTAAAVRQINTSIKEVENNLKVSANLSEATASDAEAGMEAVKKTIDGMKRIKETVDDAAEVIRRLGTKSEDIGNILNVINDVAEQVNLLALNAAIIAAQAGEHGKGFAVVADEIKGLANRTTASTEEIAALIKSVQTEAANAVKSAEAGGKSVETGVNLSQLAGEALEKILSSANSSRQMVEQIASASAEQLKGSQQANEAMEKISDMISKVYKAIEDQEKGSAYIAKAAEKMKDAATQSKRATKEQSKGGELISKAIENISGTVNSINRATQEQAKGSQEVVRAVEEIKGIAEGNVNNIKVMRDAAGTLVSQIDILENTVRSFKV